LAQRPRILNANFALAQAFWYQGEFQRAEELITTCLPDIRGERRLKQTGTTGTASLLSLVCLAKTQAIMGQSEKAFATIREANAVAESTGKPFDLSYGKVGYGFCLLMRNDPWSAVRELEDALNLARSADIALLVPSSERYLGRAYALTGRLQEARDLLTKTIERTAASGLLGMRLWSSAALGMTETLLRSAAAGETLMSTLEAARRYNFRPLQAHLMRLIGNLHAMSVEKHPQAIEPWYQRSIRLAKELGMSPEVAQGQRELAAYLQRMGAREQRLTGT
jgi:tetratricopeptide (TPR) repeat protein